MNSKIILDDFEKALRNFELAPVEPTDDELMQAGCIRYLESLNSERSKLEG